MTRPLLYRDFVRTLAGRVATNLESIEVGHNFEYGVEFEITLCEALRSALPDRYGIARGYVVDQAGASAGDDILIFAKERFPTLALRDRDDFARKEFVPVEATYCYIEAKHSVVLNDSGKQSLEYACEQVSRVKALCSARPAVSFSQLNPYSSVGLGIGVTGPPEYSAIMNPAFGVVFARYVRAAPKAPPCSGAEIEQFMSGFRVPGSHPPDIFVFGDSLVVVPSLLSEGGGRMYRSPFYIVGRSSYSAVVVDKLAFGIGFASILPALDWIKLGVPPWHKIIVDGLGIPP